MEIFKPREKGTLPKNWQQVSIQDWQAVSKIIREEPDNTVTQAVEIVYYFTGRAKDELYNLDFAKEFKPLFAGLDFLSKLPSDVFIKAFEIEGVTYKAQYKAHNLDVFQTGILQDLSKTPEMVIANLHYICAALIHPKGKKPQDGFEERAELFLTRLPIAVAYPLAAFFLRLYVGFLAAIQISSEKQKNPGKLKRIATKLTGWLKSGGGITQLPKSNPTA